MRNFDLKYVENNREFHFSSSPLFCFSIYFTFMPSFVQIGDMTNDETSENFRVACAVPNQLKNGHYKAFGKMANPGQLLPFWSSMFYECDENHIPTKKFSYCDVSGSWFPDNVQCIRACPNLQSNTVDFQCTYMDNEIPCNSIMKPETIVKTFCKDKDKETNPKELKCIEGQWNLNSTLKCTADCIVPPRPLNGDFKVLGKYVEPGQKVPSMSSLFYECDKSHISTKEYSRCDENGEWFPNNVECIKPCHNLQSSTVDFRCTYLGDEIPCDSLMKPNTIVKTSCKVRHKETILNRLKTLKCIKGEWDDPNTPKCKAECGEEMSRGTGLSIGAQEEKKEGSPWHIGIYSTENGRFTYICGGSIVSARIVISAAHCFYDDRKGKISPESSFAVAAGKRLRLWEADEEYVQKSKIDKIIISNKYGGFEQNLQHDMAILVMETAFKFGDSVHPVCIDLDDDEFKDLQLKPGSIGKVAGWGITEEGNISSVSPTLLVVNLPVIDYKTCKSNMLPTFARFLTDDKLCAGYLNGTTVCKGDSGGGLVFPTTERGTTRYYLRAIVSVSDMDETLTTCKKNAYTGFTNIWNHKDVIKESIDKYI